ncbi:hypothetical protein Tco_0958442 [Tanacetum coccineum]
MVEEPLRMKKKDQVLFDEQEAIRLQAQFDEEERISREKEEANAALIAQWNDIQNKKRRKHFAVKRAEERRNRPPTKAQQRSIMCTYLKNMAGWKPKDLKTNSFANVQELFDKAMKKVNYFVDMNTELVGGSEVREEGNMTREESSSKRVGDELEQEPSKKQKMDGDQETAKLQSMMEVISDEEEVTVDAIPLAIKPPSIVDWKIIKEGKIGYYQIIRVDGNSKRLEEEYERVLWGDLKIMFEHNIEDTMWRNLLGNKGRIVRIKSLLEVTAVNVLVTAAKHKLLVLLVQKFLLLVLKVNAASIKVTTAERIKTAQRKEKRLLMGYV